MPEAGWQQYLPLLDAALCNRWQAVLQIAREGKQEALRDFLLHNDLGPTLYWLVQRADASSALPGALLLELMGSASHARLHNEQLLAVLNEVVTAARQRGIELISLKGLHHTELLYGDISARRIRDIDVLITPSQREALAEVLLTLGFSPGPRLPQSFERYLTHATHWRCGPIEIDVHHALRAQPGYRLDVAGFITRCREQRIFSVQALVPTESDSLLLMLLSLCNDLERGVVRARSLVDLWLLLGRCDNTLNWPEFFTQLDAQRLQQPALAALRVVCTGLPGALATLPGLSVALAGGDAVSRNAALALLSGKPFAGRRWFMRHGPLPLPAYLAWYIGGMPLRHWANR